MSNTGLQAVLTLKNLRELRFACVGVGGNRRLEAVVYIGPWEGKAAAHRNN
jgi:hypothetical protein